MKKKIVFRADIDTRVWFLLPDLALAEENNQTAIGLVFLCFALSLTINKK